MSEDIPYEKRVLLSSFSAFRKGVIEGYGHPIGESSKLAVGKISAEAWLRDAQKMEESLGGAFRAKSTKPETLSNTEQAQVAKLMEVFDAIYALAIAKRTKKTMDDLAAGRVVGYELTLLKAAVTRSTESDSYSKSFDEIIQSLTHDRQNDLLELVRSQISTKQEALEASINHAFGKPRKELLQRLVARVDEILDEGLGIESPGQQL